MLQPRSYKIYLNENTIAISKRQAWPCLLPFPLKQQSGESKLKIPASE